MRSQKQADRHNRANARDLSHRKRRAAERRRVLELKVGPLVEATNIARCEGCQLAVLVGDLITQTGRLMHAHCARDAAGELR